MEANARLVEKVEEIERYFSQFQEERDKDAKEHEATLRELEVARLRVEVLEAENKDLHGEVARLSG